MEPSLRGIALTLGMSNTQLGQGNEAVHKIITGLLTVAFIAGMGAFAWKACATDEPPTQTEAKPAGGDAAGGTGEAAGGDAAGGGDCCKADDTTPPLDLVKATPKGGLHNPYKDKVTDAAFTEEGHKTYLSAGCNGCHGGGGGGGMCPPLTNDTWVVWSRRRHPVPACQPWLRWAEDSGLSPRQAGGRGGTDAALWRDPQVQRSAVEDHHLHPLGESSSR